VPLATVAEFSQLVLRVLPAIIGRNPRIDSNSHWRSPCGNKGPVIPGSIGCSPAPEFIDLRDTEISYPFSRTIEMRSIEMRATLNRILPQF
jgi:hypothetical protein